MTITETTKLAQEHYPALQLKVPVRVPKFALYAMAGLMEFSAKLNRKPPVVTRKDIAMFSGLQQDFDLSKSRNELGFNPKEGKQAVEEALDYLIQHEHLL